MHDGSERAGLLHANTSQRDQQQLKRSRFAAQHTQREPADGNARVNA